MENLRDTTTAEGAKVPSPQNPSKAESEALVDQARDELHYLNVHHSYALEAGKIKDLKPLLPGAGAFSQFKNFLRQKLRRFLFGSVLDEYLRNEQQFQANLVRLLNKMDRMQKMERPVLSGAEVRVPDLHAVHHRFAEQEERLKIAEAVIRGLERIIAVAGRVEMEDSATPSLKFTKDYSYLLLENRFRGSEEEIEKRLSVYIPEFRAVHGPVLEIGSGRGELQNLFRRAGIKSYGLDLDRAMVERSKASGLDVRHEDGLQHLEGLAENSLGGLIAVQVVEHLPYEVLRRFLELARSRVETGGIVIAETIDTSSLVALSQNYFRDPTHEAPLHPDTLRYLFELSGLEVLKVQKLSPYPEGFQLEPLSPEAFPSGSEEAVSTLNENIRKLNALFYGYQDYSVVARVP